MAFLSGCGFLIDPDLLTLSSFGANLFSIVNDAITTGGITRISSKVGLACSSEYIFIGTIVSFSRSRDDIESEPVLSWRDNIMGALSRDEYSVVERTAVAYGQMVFQYSDNREV